MKRRANALWTLAVLVLILGLDTLAPTTWVGRGLVFAILAGAAFRLPVPWTLAVGLLAIPGDIMLIRRTPHSLDLLVWSTYVAVPYLVSLRLRPLVRIRVSPGGGEEKTGSGPGRSPRGPGAGRPAVATDSPHNPSGVLEDMVVRSFRRAHDRLGTDNLLYFHVREREATLGYLINDRGEIDVGTIRARDVSQGVGWVLRHERALVQRARQVDWRNLHYHTRRIDLQEVHMYPVEGRDTVLGVLVLEWADGANYDEEVLEAFREDLEKLMRLDYSVRSMARDQKQYRLVEEINRLHERDEPRFEALVNRALELIDSYVPAERIELFRTDRSHGDEKVLDQRRLLYRKAADWIEERGEILRADNIRNRRLGGRRGGQFAPPDVRSFLAGPLDTAGGRLGVVCLDHPEEGLFTASDERLLGFFLDHLGTTLSSAYRLERLRRERGRAEEVFDLLATLGDGNDFEEESERLVRTLAEQLPTRGAGLYWKREEAFRLTSYHGEHPPSGSLPHDHALVRAVRDARRGRVPFPDVSRFEDFEPPGGTAGMEVIPVRDRGRALLGFVTLFHDREGGGIPEWLDKAAGLLARRLCFLHRERTLRNRARRDTLTDCLRFGAWKRDLARRLEEEPGVERVVWSIRVPGWTRLCEARGRTRAARWLHRVEAQLREATGEAPMCRSHGATFLGHTSAPLEAVRERMEAVRKRLASGSFPLGSRPEEPLLRIRGFQPPFPDPEGMIESVLGGEGEVARTRAQN